MAGVVQNPPIIHAILLGKENVMDISGKVVLITGASRGIGASTARLLADAGAAVVLVGRHSDALREVVRSIEAAGGKALGVVADVAEPVASRHMAEATIKHFGRLD
jgi:NAD(P)-dependent dehydrogenase (short-subunit alcohol dehydrogenase family)